MRTVSSFALYLDLSIDFCARRAPTERQPCYSRSHIRLRPIHVVFLHVKGYEMRLFNKSLFKQNVNW